MDSMGIDLASLPCRDMVPKNHENLFGYHRSAPNQVRYIKDMNVYIVTAVISLFAYLWSRPKPAQVDSVTTVSSLEEGVPKLPIDMLSRES